MDKVNLRHKITRRQDPLNLLLGSKSWVQDPTPHNRVSTDLGEFLV